MATLPEFMQKRLARKTTDITRLTDQYKQQVDAMTGEYTKSFDAYTAKRNETMAPYEAAVGQYQQQFTGYETALAGYKQRLADYTAKLQASIDTPLAEVARDKYKAEGVMRYGTRLQIDGNWYSAGDGIQASDLPDGYTYESGKLYKATAPGKFEEKAPSAPEAPTAPVVEEFDTTQFDAKRKELSSNLSRELGERKAAKTNAVSRKQARPLLQGAA